MNTPRLGSTKRIRTDSTQVTVMDHQDTGGLHIILLPPSATEAGSGSPDGTTELEDVTRDSLEDATWQDAEWQ